MFLCDQWRDYEVLDTGDGEKLERWGGIVLRRPDPQVIWPKADPALWDAAQATYMRSDTGGGHWEFREKLPDRPESGGKSINITSAHCPKHGNDRRVEKCRRTELHL